MSGGEESVSWMLDEWKLGSSQGSETPRKVRVGAKLGGERQGLFLLRGPEMEHVSRWDGRERRWLGQLSGHG